MNSKMVVRILSISMALLFFGMVVPSLADIVAPTSIDFEEVTVGTSRSVELIVTYALGPINVSLAVVYDDPDYADCGFTVQPDTIEFSTTPTENATVTYAPTAVDECRAKLQVYFVGYGRPIDVPLTGTGVAAGPKTVVIDGHDTGVENVLYEGDPISEYLETCSENAKNHGQYVRCVGLMTRKMRHAKVLNKEGRRSIMKAAAHANIPPIEAGLEGLEYDGKPVVQWIDECRESAENRKQYRRCVYKLMKEMKKEGVITTKKERQKIGRYAAHMKFRGRHWKK